MNSRQMVRQTRDPLEWGRLIVALVDKVREVAESWPTAEELRKPHFAVESYGWEYEAIFDAIDAEVEIHDPYGLSSFS